MSWKHEVAYKNAIALAIQELQIARDSYNMQYLAWALERLELALKYSPPVPRISETEIND